jgi:hypothetical protein
MIYLFLVFGAFASQGLAAIVACKPGWEWVSGLLDFFLMFRLSGVLEAKKPTSFLYSG